MSMKPITQKLSDNDILDIFRLRVAGNSTKELGDLYGLDRATVANVLYRRSFKHVEIPEEIVGEVRASKRKQRPRFATLEDRFRDVMSRLEVDMDGDCWIVNFESSRGVMRTGKSGRPTMRHQGKTYILSRLIVREYNNLNIQPLLRDDGIAVRHTCDRAQCVNPSHLITGSIADNNHDISKRGRARNQHGEQKVMVDDAVHVIKCWRYRFMSVSDISRDTGIDTGTVSAIIKGKRFSYIDPDVVAPWTKPTFEIVPNTVTQGA